MPGSSPISVTIRSAVLKVILSLFSAFIVAMSMSRQQRLALNRALPRLVQDLEVTPCITHLIATDLFSHADSELLEAVGDRCRRIQIFISMLQRRGQRAYQVFVATLNETAGTRHLATYLQQLSEEMTRDNNI